MKIKYQGLVHCWGVGVGIVFFSDIPIKWALNPRPSVRKVSAQDWWDCSTCYWTSPVLNWESCAFCLKRRWNTAGTKHIYNAIFIILLLFWYFWNWKVKFTFRLPARFFRSLRTFVGVWNLWSAPFWMCGLVKWLSHHRTSIKVGLYIFFPLSVLYLYLSSVNLPFGLLYPAFLLLFFF